MAKYRAWEKQADAMKPSGIVASAGRRFGCVWAGYRRAPSGDSMELDARLYVPTSELRLLVDDLLAAKITQNCNSYSVRASQRCQRKLLHLPAAQPRLVLSGGQLHHD
jgi:hypothetical protein